MTASLLIIDPQKDFCDIPGAALPVAGANADMQRLAAFLDAVGPRLTEVMVTLDSHPVVAIERPTFWVATGGADVAPFTTITHAQVLAGDFQPRNIALLPDVLAYLKALEAGGKYTLMVWTVHCVTATWGHTIHDDVAAALMRWESNSLKEVEKVLKGRNPLTEQYSAIRAEVPREDDPRTGTNTALVERVLAGTGSIYVAGEASSHCVAATMRDLFAFMDAATLARVVILRDCMSPVGGFEAAQTAFFEECRGLGVRVITKDEALAELA